MNERKKKQIIIIQSTETKNCCLITDVRYSDAWFFASRDQSKISFFFLLAVHRSSTRRSKDYRRGKSLRQRRYYGAELHQCFFVSGGSVTLVHQRSRGKFSTTVCLLSILLHFFSFFSFFFFFPSIFRDINSVVLYEYFKLRRLKQKNR